MDIKIEHMHGDIIEQGGVKNVTQNFYDGTRPEHGEDVRLPDEDSEVIDRLAPFFWNRRKEAASFLQRIKGTPDAQITSLVTQLVEEGKISDLSCKGDLWEVLHGHGLYKAGRANWNGRVRPDQKTVEAKKHKI